MTKAAEIVMPVASRRPPWLSRTSPAARLGYAESVVGRLNTVGGRARIFSSPGSGTTVMLEVPKP